MEFVRLPDSHIGFIAFGWVTLPMIVVGPGAGGEAGQVIYLKPARG